MLRSMFSAISGMRAHQTKLDVTGNNIANVNTVGFKSSQTVFEDTLSQVVRNGGAPGEDLGGTNPAQVGLGVKVAGISTNFTQGATQATGRKEDFMISGDGFFVTKAGAETIYTRAGSMSFDSTGQLVTPDGAKLQGWPAVNGVVNANGAIGNLSIPFGQISAPRSTTTAAITGNLPAEAVVGTKIYSKVDMFDGQGTAQAVAYEFEKTGANAWTLRVQNIPPVTTPPTAPTVLATQALTFSATTGALTAPAAPSTVSVATVGTFPSMTGPVVLSLAGMVQFGSKASLDTDTQNGYAMGTLNSFALGDDGTLTGNFSNDQRVSLGKLALATFDNPTGLASFFFGFKSTTASRSSPALGSA